MPVGHFLLLCALLIPTAMAPGQSPGLNPPAMGPVQPLPDRPEEEEVRLDHPYFESVEDDAPLARGQKGLSRATHPAAFEEMEAYDYVLAHARKQPVERLKKFAMHDVPYANLFNPIRQDYLRELIHLEGRLALLMAMKPTPGLEKREKFDKLYDAWIYVPGSQFPFCLVVSELPAGVAPGEDLNLRVSVDAYYFKLFRYESRQDKGDGKKQWNQAPLFLGRTFESAGPMTTDVAPYSGSMLATIVAVLAGLALTVAGFAWWYRRGDRHIKGLAARRLQEISPFENEAAQPVPEIRGGSETH